ncbi:unnamed protein product [Amoebophrya sp. A25]|nr:unnamed protein product [Amoebophrya sp. A25]|eukprot:GSA25T00016170001.1
MGHFGLLFRKNARTSFQGGCGGLCSAFLPGIFMLLLGVLSLMWFILDASLFNQRFDWDYGV